MKKLFSKSVLILSVLLLCVFAFSACSKTSDETREYNVVLNCPDGVTVEGSNPVTVKHGGTVTFKVTTIL